MTRVRGAWLAILLFAAALRFYGVSAMPLRADEAVNIQLARANLDEIVRTFSTADPHQPLYFVLLHFWLRVAGSSEIAARFPTLGAGIALVALEYVLARRFFPRQPMLALAAATLLALNPTSLWDAQDAHMYALLTPTLLAAFLALERVMRTRAARGEWIVYILASAVSLHLHYFAAFALVAHGVVWVSGLITRQVSFRQTLVWLSACVAIGVLFLPWLVVALPLLINFKTDFLPAAALGEMLLRALHAFSVGRVDARLLTPMSDPLWGNVGAGAFLLAFIGGLAARGAARARAILSVYWLSALGAMFLFSWLRFPIFDERYVAFLTPVFIVLVARGIVSVSAPSRPAWLSIGAFVLLGLINASSLYNYFFVPAYAKSPDWISLAQRIVTQVQPGDVVIQNYPDPALPYYLRERVPRVLLPRSASATMSEVNLDLQRLTAKYTRLWFQAAPYSTWDPQGLVALWLSRHTRAVGVSEFRGLRLALYLPAAVALGAATPLDATFDEQIRLRAFECARANTQLRVTLYWQALVPPTRAATVFVHLYDADAKLWSQQDNAPVNGTYPTTDWAAEVLVVDEYTLTIPNDAPTKLGAYVGLYDSLTQERWRARDGRGDAFAENRVPLCAVERR